MDLLDNPVRNYAWGSRTSIAARQGRPVPSAEPEAELWMGAHPDSPSRICRDGAPPVTVGDAVAADPVGLLGAAVLHRYGPRLPFMLKVLAAESPLSLQAHPDAETAASRYADEQAAGLRRGNPGRNYADPYAKPEMLVALDDFDALCGFRDPAESATVLASLDVSVLDPVIARLRHGTTGDRLRGAVEMLLRWPDPDRAAVVSAVVRAVAGTTGRAGIGHVGIDHAGVDRVGVDHVGIGHVVDLGRQFPRDPGVVVALLLNRVRLHGGEAIWMPAGNMHAYLRGTGMEVLGASDNVLRGGLTVKTVDVDELLRVLRFEVLAEPVVKPVVLAPGVLTWPVAIPEFAIFRVEVGAGVEAVELPLEGPRIVFCAHGALTVGDDRGGATITLAAGAAGFGAAGRPLWIGGEGVAYVATTGPTV